MKIKTYQKDLDYTYTLGVFETIELLENKPELVLRIYLKTNSKDNRGITKINDLCKKHNIEIIYSDKTINHLAKKDNCLCVGIIKKYSSKLEEGNHVVLVNPSDMGNMGTIIRTMVGFNYNNLAIIAPGVDVFNPKVIRSSMGAVFSINIEYFNSFKEYKERFNHDIYTLMLKGATNIYQIAKPTKYHTLVFGNESSGLDDSYLNEGTSIFIPHSKNIDSLNLSMALGITLANFSKDNFQDVKVLGGKMDN
ncbi:MAG: TrmH family RNA methyltransferase [Thomasclavelia sp.]|nr:TrmH family RNA methyltransferase [Thomasclavelia sp.]